MDRKKLVSWGVPIALLVILGGYLIGDLQWGLTVAAVMLISYSLLYVILWAKSRRENNFGT